MAASRTGGGGTAGEQGGRDDRPPSVRVRAARGLGEIAPESVSEGGLEPPRRGIFPGSGKLCNKGSASMVNASGYSAASSLFRSPPGLYMAGRHVRASSPAVTTWLSGRWGAGPSGVSTAELRNQLRAAFRDERGGPRVRHRSVREHFADAGSHVQSMSPRHVTIRRCCGRDE
jgi:hypothetical protein